MTEVLTAATEESLEKSTGERPSDAAPSDATSPPPPPLPPRRGIQDCERDRRDDRDFDRPPRREYYDRNRSPPPPPPRDRDYHKRGRMSPSPPPPPYRDRRGGGPHSPPPRRSPQFPPYKRRRDDVYDGRRGSPRGGYGPGDRRVVPRQDIFHANANHLIETQLFISKIITCSRPGPGPDERPHGRYMGRSAGGYQGCASGAKVGLTLESSTNFAVYGTIIKVDGFKKILHGTFRKFKEKIGHQHSNPESKIPDNYMEDLCANIKRTKDHISRSCLFKVYFC